MIGAENRVVERGGGRVEEGRWTGTYWQPVVSLPRSSNRTCPFRASGSPTDFTASSRKRPQMHIERFQRRHAHNVRGVRCQQNGPPPVRALRLFSLLMDSPPQHITIHEPLKVWM